MEKGRERRGELKVFICPLAGCYLNLKGCGGCRKKREQNAMQLPGVKTVLECTVNTVRAYCLMLCEAHIVLFVLYCSLKY